MPLAQGKELFLELAERSRKSRLVNGERSLQGSAPRPASTEHRSDVADIDQPLILGLGERASEPLEGDKRRNVEQGPPNGRHRKVEMHRLLDLPRLMKH